MHQMSPLKKFGEEKSESDKKLNCV